jgi:DNA-directed RNA polymerase subunit E'/Rpb7
VELRVNKCEGMLSLRDLPGDLYKFDQERYSVIGQRTGQKFQLGQELTVKIRAVDMDKRTVELMLLEKGVANRTGQPIGEWDETRPSSGGAQQASRNKATAQSRERSRKALGKKKRR